MMVPMPGKALGSGTVGGGHILSPRLFLAHPAVTVAKVSAVRRLKGAVGLGNIWFRNSRHCVVRCGGAWRSRNTLVQASITGKRNEWLQLQTEEIATGDSGRLPAANGQKLVRAGGIRCLARGSTGQSGIPLVLSGGLTKAGGGQQC